MGLSPLAQKHYEKYLQYLKECQQEIGGMRTPDRIDLGSGPSGGDLFQKRQQIRGMLRLRGDAAFSLARNSMRRVATMASHRVQASFCKHKVRTSSWFSTLRPDQLQKFMILAASFTS